MDGTAILGHEALVPRRAEDKAKAVVARARLVVRQAAPRTSFVPRAPQQHAAAHLASESEREPPAVPEQKAWITAEEVAQLVLRGECLSAGVSVPSAFSRAALDSALRSVDRWRNEGRIFAINERYPRYQFDNFGRPHAPVECVLALLGSAGALRVGHWFSMPNTHLQGKTPQDLLASDPNAVLNAVLYA